MCVVLFILRHLSATFDLKIEGQLLDTSGLCIPSNNTMFIKTISEKLAVNEPHLTLEFLEECIQVNRICIQFEVTESWRIMHTMHTMHSMLAEKCDRTDMIRHD